MMFRLIAGAMLVLCGAGAGSAQSGDDAPYHVGEIRVGDRVTVDPSLMNRWQSCTVVALRPSYSDPSLVDNFSVRCDNGSTYMAMSSHQMIRPGGGGGPAPSPNNGMRGGNAAGQMPAPPAPPAAPVRRAPAPRPAGRAGTLDVPTVEQVIEQGFRPPDPGVGVTMDWHDVQIAAPRIISAGDVVHEGIAAGTRFYPVEVSYSRTTTVGSFTQTRGVTQYYMFYVDEFGRWAGVPAAHSGNRSDVR